VRHYFGYDINGSLTTVEIYGPSGWPSTHCMEDPECMEAAVTSLRESRAKDAPGVIDWVVFDCPCDPGQGDLLKDCGCFNTKYAENYVDTVSKTLVPKPMRTVLVDDVVVTPNQVITKDPGTVVVLKISAVGMPDGETAVCAQKGMVDLCLEDAWDLTFTGGVTDTKELTAPAQGTKGAVFVGGRLMRPMSFILRGFATP
jgi:hypothetical protein